MTEKKARRSPEPSADPVQTSAPEEQTAPETEADPAAGPEAIAPPAEQATPPASVPARRRGRPAQVLGRYLVKFKDNPDLVVEAADRHDAWRQYKQAHGILGTPHEPSIQLLGEEDKDHGAADEPEPAAGPQE